MEEEDVIEKTSVVETTAEGAWEVPEAVEATVEEELSAMGPGEDMPEGARA